MCCQEFATKMYQRNISTLVVAGFWDPYASRVSPLLSPSVLPLSVATLAAPCSSWTWACASDASCIVVHQCSPSQDHPLLYVFSGLCVPKVEIDVCL